MTAKLIDGKAISALIRADLKAEIKTMVATPGLAVVMVGDNAASKVYVRNKQKACSEVGMYSEIHMLPAETTDKELILLIKNLNSNERIHGILVQLPLPAHLNEELVIANISPDKDVDAFHAENVGKIMIGKPNFMPCTPAGVMSLLKHTGIDVAGLECVVVGRSNIVGKPMAMLLLASNGTVTICHSKTKNLAEVCRRADVLVVAIGKAEFITGDMVKPGAVVIDVGMNRSAEGKLVGDVDFDSVSQVASHITPVPGGVGPMTITSLLCNTVTAVKSKKT
ncbi:MAG: bifunctional methylenetetrahydrofolate dehydrogenase/methenyltetrahydrofolate cyclohydrolase FolD [Eubacteriales bacterium]|nr:bifunctional methylenetetrahydrofolate dehydrogenase/methenyltetrahydrofolate cyclohydrolase FolD [Eubacteriales bacterium]